MAWRATLGCDGMSDVIPSDVTDIGMPIHTVAIVAMGLPVSGYGPSGEPDRALLSSGIARGLS